MIDGLCITLNPERKAAANSTFDQRLETLYSHYLKALRKDLLSLSFRENIRCNRYPLMRDEKLESYPTGGLIEPMVVYPGVTTGETYQVLVDKKADSIRLRLYDESGENLQADHTWDTRQTAEGIRPRQIKT